MKIVLNLQFLRRFSLDCRITNSAKDHSAAVFAARVAPIASRELGLIMGRLSTRLGDRAAACGLPQMTDSEPVKT